jgi:hydroxyethylthiazole kinase-like uncharacterized protein yjeF
MRLGYTAQQIRDAEAPHLAAGEPLMARAAAALAAVIRDVLDARGVASGRVLLLVGSGNNGGDALFAGAELAGGGCRVTVAELGSRTHEAGLAAALDAGSRTVSASDIVATAGDTDVIVDGILGTGAVESPALRGVARDIVAELLPLLGRPDSPAVVAVDIPSGIHPDDGSVPDPAVLPADVTVTFGGYKAGLLQGPGARFAGDVRLAAIGIEDDLAAVEPAVRVP